MWSIGEFGEMLFVDTEDDIKPDINEQDVVKLLETVLFSPHSNIVTKEFTINAVMKLSVRFKHSERLDILFMMCCHRNDVLLVILKSLSITMVTI